MRTFVGILDGERNVWGVRIPDAPGCYGGGRTPEEAVSSACEALAILLAEEDYAATLPAEPTTIDALRHDPDIRDALARGEALVLITPASDAFETSAPLAAE